MRIDNPPNRRIHSIVEEIIPGCEKKAQFTKSSGLGNIDILDFLGSIPYYST
jgi:hypothetical protein